MYGVASQCGLQVTPLNTVNKNNTKKASPENYFYQRPLEKSSMNSWACWASHIFFFFFSPQHGQSVSHWEKLPTWLFRQLTQHWIHYFYRNAYCKLKKILMTEKRNVHAWDGCENIIWLWAINVWECWYTVLQQVYQQGRCRVCHDAGLAWRKRVDPGLCTVYFPYQDYSVGLPSLSSRPHMQATSLTKTPLLSHHSSSK